jgi:polyisoprenoid-binding protein YceI
VKYLVLILGLLATTACSKTDEPAAQAAPKPAPPKPTAPAAEADHVRILASHADPKPDDPVTIDIPGFRVVKAAFDPAKLEGGTATIELDLASLVSDSPKRDKHVKHADYLDVEQYGIATITVDNVESAGGDHYTADARVAIHGVDKVLPVTFDVIERLPDGIRVRGEHVFSRHDFAIGAPEGGDDSAASQQKIQLQLTLKNM